MYLQRDLAPAVAGLPVLRWWAGASARLWQRAAAARGLRPAPTKPSDAEGLLVVGNSEQAYGAVQVPGVEEGWMQGWHGGIPPLAHG